MKTQVLQPVGRPFLDCFSISIGTVFGAAILPDIFAVMAHKPVAFAGHAVRNLAGCGDFEAFLDTAFGLQLGHFGLL